MTTALLYPVTRNCDIVETGNDSCRFRRIGVATKSRIDVREQAKRGGTTVEPF